MCFLASGGRLAGSTVAGGAVVVDEGEPVELDDTEPLDVVLTGGSSPPPSHAPTASNATTPSPAAYLRRAATDRLPSPAQTRTECARVYANHPNRPTRRPQPRTDPNAPGASTGGTTCASRGRENVERGST